MQSVRSFSFYTLISALLLLAGCVSFSSPVQTGENTYMITANARGGFSSNGDLENETIQRATNFCAARGLSTSVQNAGASGVQGWTPQNTQVAFKCLPSCDMLFADPALDPIRTKVALSGVKDQTLEMRSNNSKPTPVEASAISLWDQKRHECEIGNPAQAMLNATPVAGSVLVNNLEDVEQLIAELYDGQITYAQFAAQRSALYERTTMSASNAFEAERLQNVAAGAALTSAHAQVQSARAQTMSAEAQQTAADAEQYAAHIRPPVSMASPAATSVQCRTIGDVTNCTAN
jgi:hypothetical protein